MDMSSKKDAFLIRPQDGGSRLYGCTFTMHRLIKRAPTRRFFCVVSSFDHAIDDHA
jgi:hypothetical protein